MMKSRVSILRIRSANEQSSFRELLNLNNIQTDDKDYLFQPKEFDEAWFEEWKEYVYTLTNNELVLTPRDKSYDFKLLNISMLHILHVLGACSNLPPSVEVYEQVLKKHVENIATSCGIEREYFHKFKENFYKFLQLYTVRKEYIQNSGGEDIELNNDATNQFRASKDHLIFGKIVGDALGLHPTLGALLNPTGGIVGSNNSNKLLRSVALLPSHRKNGIIHDASGYLRYYHGIGPGYKYLDTGDVRGRLTPLNGIFYGYKLPSDDLLKYFKWKAQDIIGEDPVSTILNCVLYIFMIVCCFFVLGFLI